LPIAEYDITEENVQSRIRGVTLMALSNKFGPMLLTTGNKSEMSVGYATIYGDMAGGYNPLKDAYKMTVFAISRWRNAKQAAHRPWPGWPGDARRDHHPPPSAELRPDQKDEDSLPPYPCSTASCWGWSSTKRASISWSPKASSANRGADRAPAPPCRIQAPSGPAGGQAGQPQLRPRPALSDHPRVPECVTEAATKANGAA
jgi:hypothetical protein